MKFACCLLDILRMANRKKRAAMKKIGDGETDTLSGKRVWSPLCLSGVAVVNDQLVK